MGPKGPKVRLPSLRNCILQNRFKGDPGKPKGTQGDPRETQGDPRGPNWDPKGTQGGIQGGPQGTQGDPNGKGDPRGPKGTKSEAPVSTKLHFTEKCIFEKLESSVSL